MNPLIQMSPEVCVVLGGCLVCLIGVARRSSARAVTSSVALVTLVVAMALTAWYGRPGDAIQPAGLLITQLSMYVRWITLIVGVLIVLVNAGTPADEERGEFFGMILFSIAGVMLTGCANDLVVLFLAVELVSVPTYILVGLSRTDARASEAAVKYFFLGALAAAIMVYGFSFLYGAAGTTVLRGASGGSLSEHVASAGRLTDFATIGLLLAFAGLSFKIAAVPFHAYAPDVYEGAASSVTGLLGFLPKLAGFAAMIHLLTAIGWQLPTSLLWLLWGVAAATMTVGNVLALLQTNVKRMLAYSSIAHSGYMLIGLLVGPALGAGPMHDGVAALLFYVAVYGTMNLGAFAALGSLTVRDEPAETLDDLAGLSRRAPWTALALTVCAFSLMGFPPTAGFLGKVYVFSSAFSLSPWHPFRTAMVVLVVIAVINSAIGAAYYLRIAAACYLRDADGQSRVSGDFMLRVGLGICGAAMVVLFVIPKPLVDRARYAAAAAHPRRDAHVSVVELPPS
ncbi:MAG: NADH-quinone oxidoreductase subunit N [Phycisphaerales bacterium]|nr:NADH-quinone oxidoreductase subunit N [Phycisphaerales bacterium]